MIVPLGSIRNVAGIVATAKASTRSPLLVPLWTCFQGSLRALTKSTTADFVYSPLTSPLTALITGRLLDDGGTPIDSPKEAVSSIPDSRYIVRQNSVGDVVAGINIQ